MVLQTKSSGNYIWDLKNKDCADFISKILQLVGANDKNAPMDMQFVVENMKTVYGKWTTDELLYAIRLCLDGKITGVDMNLYDKPFNLVFISNILKAYSSQIRSPIMIQINKSESNKALLPVNIDKEKANKEAIIRSIEKIYNGEDVANALYSDCYDYLVKLNVLNLSDENRIEITKKAEEQIYQEKIIKQDKLTNQGKLIEAKHIFDRPMNLKSYQKRIAVIEFLQAKKEMDIPINEIIN